MADQDQVNRNLLGLLVKSLKEKYAANEEQVSVESRIHLSAMLSVVREYMSDHSFIIQNGELLKGGDETPFATSLSDLVDEILLHRFSIEVPVSPAEEGGWSTKSQLIVGDFESELEDQPTIPQDPLTLLGFPVQLNEIASPDRRSSADVHTAILKSAVNLFRVPVRNGEDLTWRRGVSTDLVEGTFFIPSERVQNQSILYRVGAVEHGMLLIESYGLASLEEATSLALKELRSTQVSLEQRLERNSPPSGSLSPVDQSAELFSDGYVAQLLRHDPVGYILSPRGGSYTSARMKNANVGDIFTPKLTPGQPVPFFQVVEGIRKYEWQNGGEHHYSLVAAIKGVEFSALVQYLQQGNIVAYGMSHADLSTDFSLSPTAAWLLDSIIPDGAYVHIPGSTDVVLEKIVRSGATAKGEPFSYMVFEKVDPSRLSFDVGDGDIVEGGNAPGLSTFERHLASTPGVVDTRHDENGAFVLRVKDGFMGLGRGDTSPPAGFSPALGEDVNNDTTIRGTTTMTNGNKDDESARPTGPMERPAGSGGRRVPPSPPPMPVRASPAVPLTSAQAAPTVEVPAAGLSTATVQNLGTQELAAVMVPGSVVDPTGPTHTAAHVSVPPQPMAPPPAAVVHRNTLPPVAVAPVAEPVGRQRGHDISGVPPPVAPVGMPAAVANVPVARTPLSGPRAVPPPGLRDGFEFYQFTSRGDVLVANNIPALANVIQGVCQPCVVHNIAEIPPGAFYRKRAEVQDLASKAPLYFDRGAGEKCIEFGELSDLFAHHQKEIDAIHERQVAVELDKAGHQRKVKRAIVLGGSVVTALTGGIIGATLYFNSQFRSQGEKIDSLEKALVAAHATTAEAVDKITSSAGTYNAQAAEVRTLIADFEAFKPTWDAFVSDRYAPVEAKTRQVMAILKIAQSSIDIAAGNVSVAEVVARDTVRTARSVDISSYMKSICPVGSDAQECTNGTATLVQYWVPFTAVCSDALGKVYVAAGGSEADKSGFVAREKSTWCSTDKGRPVTTQQGTHYNFTISR